MAKKVGTIPEFTDDNANAKPTEEVKEEEQETTPEPDEETTKPESSEGEKSTEEKTDEITKDESTSEPEKLAALEALRKQEEALDKDISTLDAEIEARRQRIVQKRTERREKRELDKHIGERLPETQTDDLADIDSTTLSILERFTKAKGLVPKSELETMNYETQHKTAEQSFYEKHKEYLPEFDKDDTLYTALKNELALYARPSSPTLISKLFERAHNEVKRQYPQFFKETRLIERINASQRMNAASMGGGNTGGSSNQSRPEGAKLSTIQIQALEQGGWTQEDIARLNK